MRLKPGGKTGPPLSCGRVIGGGWRDGRWWSQWAETSGGFSKTLCWKGLMCERFCVCDRGLGACMQSERREEKSECEETHTRTASILSWPASATAVRAARAVARVPRAWSQARPAQKSSGKIQGEPFQAQTRCPPFPLPTVFFRTRLSCCPTIVRNDSGHRRVGRHAAQVTRGKLHRSQDKTTTECLYMFVY